MEVLDFDNKQDVKYCIPLELRDEHIKINISKIKETVGPGPDRFDPIAIVCFGPSLKDTWQELRKFKFIMTCSGAHKFLVEKGIIPTWHMDLEPREHKIQMLGQPQPSVEYLIASTVHPRYFDQLQGFNVKLWHIYANDEVATRILPKGEWALTGGSSVGLRCMTMARFLGFRELRIFGMDGNIRPDGSHTTDHPNAPGEKHQVETEYDGKKYVTTSSILYCAKETFKELDQMPDVKAIFYGEGLVQAMAKKYAPKHIKNTILAFNHPELISKEMVELNQQLHKDVPNFGMGGAKHAEAIERLSKELKTTSILDYGCGKGLLAKSLPFPIWEYDPAIKEKSETPKAADIVVCTDVLEHIEPDKLQFVLKDIQRCIKKVGYFVVSTRKAVKTYANGQNTHLIVQGKDWWQAKLQKYFTIGMIEENPKTSELKIVVGPKVTAQPEITTVEHGGITAKFYTPNETTKWRASTLFTKEPSTVEWINSMQPGDVLFDVGANIGSYTVLAGIKGVKVYAFEPEAENYTLLLKNMKLNGLEPNAYCVAITDIKVVSTLFASQQEAGGACHSFHEEIGPDLQPRPGIHQGCIGVPLDFFWNDLPEPQHLKIDVDGLEHNVIAGAQKILHNLKSLLVEVNPDLPQHLEMVAKLEALGFTYDPAQVARATRKDGAFTGCAEYVFTRKKITPLEKYIVKRIKDTSLYVGPFSYLVMDGFFTDNVYRKILENMPTEFEPIEKSRGTKGYDKRFTAKPTTEFWKNLYDQLLSGYLRKVILEKFDIEDDPKFKEDLVLIHDLPGYCIPPHTDSTKKIISALIYLPENDDAKVDGTSIYKPKRVGFICKKGQHHKFEDFENVYTVPFKPNTALIFARTDSSFHGVEPSSHIRNVLLYNIKK